jgi:NADPH:quinone reductase-like Zn-dependent oxidoreductase
MRAVVYRRTQPGHPLVVDRDTPTLRAGQVRIAVAAAGVNPADLGVSSGGMDGLLPPGTDDWGLGWDVAGTVAQTAPDVAGLPVGTPVVAMAQLFDGDPGGQAEEVALPAGHVVVAPTSVDLVHAATLPLNAMTAAQALDLAAVEPGGTLLITGAAGAVGGFALELASDAGVSVVAAGRQSDADWLRSRGAAHVTSERGGALVDSVRGLIPGGVDAVIDAAALGGAVLGAARDGGRFVSLTVPATPEPQRGVDVRRQAVTVDGARLAALVELVDRGVLTTRVAGTRRLEEAADAYEEAARPGVRGRVVLVP